MPDWASVGILCVIVVVAGFTIWSLANQNKVLKARLEAAPLPGGLLAPGNLVPPVELVTLEGESVALQEIVEDDIRVLTFFTTTCKFCEAVLPSWQGLAASLDPGRAAMVGVSLSSVRETSDYTREKSIAWSVVMADRQTAGQLEILGVPRTVVTGNGMVLGSWSGVLSAEDIRAIRRLTTSDWWYGDRDPTTDRQ